MSITESNRTTALRDTPGAPPARRAHRESVIRRETKPSPKTTELWLLLAGVAVLAVIYNASRDASLDLFRACLLGTVMAAAYIVSRGFAKAGSHDDDEAYDRS